MLKDGFAHAEDDIAARALREAHVEADRMLLATRSALAADGDLLDAEQRAAVEALLLKLESANASNDAATVEAATKALAAGTEPFAALRMNEGIRKALAGRRLEEV